MANNYFSPSARNRDASGKRSRREEDAANEEAQIFMCEPIKMERRSNECHSIISLQTAKLLNALRSTPLLRAFCLAAAFFARPPLPGGILLSRDYFIIFSLGFLPMRAYHTSAARTHSAALGNFSVNNCATNA